MRLYQGAWYDTLILMSDDRPETTGVPTDTFELRLAIARFHAGGLSAAEAAERVGVTGQSWRNWEAGRSVGARKPAMIRYIAAQLGVDEDWLANGGPLPTGGPGPGTEVDADSKGSGPWNSWSGKPLAVA